MKVILEKVAWYLKFTEVESCMNLAKQKSRFLGDFYKYQL